MTCQEALNTLYDVIDKEAATITTDQVREHLSKCKQCAERYELEASVDELIKARLNNNQPSENLQSLKSKVLQQLDEIDLGKCNDETSESANPGGRSASLSMGRLVTIAAALVVFVGVAYYGNHLYAHQAFLPLETAHWAAADDYAPFQNASVTTTVREKVSSQMAYSLELLVQRFALVGAKETAVDGASISQFLYSFNDQTVSVFVGSVDLLPIPEDLRDAGLPANGITFYDHHCRGCRLVYHQIGNTVIVTASADTDVELLEFVPGFGTI